MEKNVKILVIINNFMDLNELPYHEKNESEIVLGKKLFSHKKSLIKKRTKR